MRGAELGGTVGVRMHDNLVSFFDCSSGILPGNPQDDCSGADIDAGTARSADSRLELVTTTLMRSDLHFHPSSDIKLVIALTMTQIHTIYLLDSCCSRSQASDSSNHVS